VCVCVCVCVSVSERESIERIEKGRKGEREIRERIIQCEIASVYHFRCSVERKNGLNILWMLCKCLFVLH